jgi:hypothetical protein
MDTLTLDLWSRDRVSLLEVGQSTPPVGDNFRGNLYCQNYSHPV